jgi:hypothetical protein
MLELLRLLAEVGTAANWIAIFIAAVIAVFLLYLGIALRARATRPRPGTARSSLPSLPRPAALV